VAPVETLGGVLGLSLEYATDPGDATASFFRGALTDDPGAAFYPVALLYRATPSRGGCWPTPPCTCPS